MIYFFIYLSINGGRGAGGWEGLEVKFWTFEGGRGREHYQNWTSMNKGGVVITDAVGNTLKPMNLKLFQE